MTGAGGVEGGAIILLGPFPNLKITGKSWKNLMKLREYTYV
jgi:hypothetical protein